MRHGRWRTATARMVAVAVLAAATLTMVTAAPVDASSGAMILEFDTRRITDRTVRLPVNMSWPTPEGLPTTPDIPVYDDADITVDWGDGTVETFTGRGMLSHTYRRSGVHRVTITGDLPLYGAYRFDARTGPRSDLDRSNAGLLRVVSFGDVGLLDLHNAFIKTRNVRVAATLPATVRSLDGTFAWASGNPTGFERWDTSNVTSMRRTFIYALDFTGDVSRWDTSNVTSMRAMFSYAKKFNGNIGRWDTSNVTDMQEMFSETSRFNQNLSGWCVAAIAETPHLFAKSTPRWTRPKPPFGQPCRTR